MSRITVYGNKKSRKAVLEFLQRRRIMDISPPCEDGLKFGFTTLNTNESQSEFLRCSDIGERSLAILDEYAPQKSTLFSSLDGRIVLTAQQYYSYIDDIPEILRISKRITEIASDIGARRSKIIKLQAETDELTPWLTLDVEMKLCDTKKCAVFIGVFPAELDGAALSELYHSESAPEIYTEIISSSAHQTAVFAVCAKADAAECENRLRQIGFSLPKSSYKGIPRDEVSQRQQMTSALEKEISTLTEELVSYSGARSAIRFMTDYYSMRAEKYNVLAKLSQSKNVFAIEGYVPTADAAELIAELENSYDAAVQISDAGDDAPVMLKNKYLAQPVEGIVKTFALPARGEIDPTAIMAFFYYLFFGMMLSDAAYGLIITLGCGIVLHKFRNMESSMHRSLRMFMYCGISTMFWGILFGSWFGDVLPVVSSTFFGKEITVAPLWFEPVNDPMRMLMFSFLLGIIHLFTALGIKLYQCVKAKDYASMFTDCIFWYMLVGGGIAYLFHVDMFLTMAGLTVRLPDMWASIAAITAITGAVGILLFTARSGGAGKRLAKGAYALYGVTGWLSDILSYSRLLALGLATGVIATVFNEMGSMFGGGIVGAIIFIPIFIIGHALNIGINLLGAYVHTNRLQFVEFFGKFYDGGGKEFEPFETKTKYYKFKEEQ